MAKDKTYLVSVPAGRHGYASTLVSAKKLGASIARLTERNDTKWNVAYVTVSILKENGIGFYKHTGWKMMVPVRGSGMQRKVTVARIKKRHGVLPFRWSRR